MYIHFLTLPPFFKLLHSLCLFACGTHRQNLLLLHVPQALVTFVYATVSLHLRKVTSVIPRTQRSSFPRKGRYSVIGVHNYSVV